MDLFGSESISDLSCITLSSFDDSHNRESLSSPTTPIAAANNEESDDRKSLMGKDGFFEIFDTDLLNGQHDEGDYNNTRIDYLIRKAERRFHKASLSMLDDVMRKGAVHDILQNLHQVLLIHSQCRGSRNDCKQEQVYRSTLDHSQAVQVSILCRTLQLLVRCRDHALKTAMTSHKVYNQLKRCCLPRVLSIYASSTACPLETNIRVQTINSCLEILRRANQYMPAASVVPLVHALARLLEPRLELGCDVRISAAGAIARCLDGARNHRERQVLLELILDEYSTAVISVLSTAALVVTDDLLDDCLIGLCRLTKHTALCAKVARRRCALLAMRQHVTHNDVNIRIKAVALCRAVLNESSGNLDKNPETSQETESMLVATLIRASMEEIDASLKLQIIETLRTPLVIRKDFSHKASIMRTLCYHSKAPSTDPKIVIQTSLFYLQAANTWPLDEEVAVNIVRYLSSPYTPVRLAAIQNLNDLTFWYPMAANCLIAETDFFNAMCRLLTHGSTAELTCAMAVCEQIMADTKVHIRICQHTALLTALANLVTTDHVTRRGVYTKAVNILLEIMSGEDANLQCFKHQPKVLPWLVRFANRTTDDDELKRKVVSSIVRLSTMLLND
ncbi:hypothetical protein MPSEU_000630500 [Mayamaea pseudoterrestris]|nr:hypothetical protein MPSEU_000630500 [Mayamaea pseudoterrestris]